MSSTLLDKPILFHDPNYHKRILLFDIETAPNLAYVWGKWEQDVLSFKEHWYIISFAYKWLGEKETYVLSLPDFKTYKKHPTNDELLVNKLWDLFDKSDVIIAHNGDAFDIKKSNARFLKHGLEPPSPYATIDTLKIARKYFKLDSNKLDDLGDFFNIGRKIQTGGFNLWLGCIAGDKEAWKKMTEYNKRDVILLEKVYLKLRGWNKQSAYINLVLGRPQSCRNCGGEHLHSHGEEWSGLSKYHRWKCLGCGANLKSIPDKDKPLR